MKLTLPSISNLSLSAVSIINANFQALVTAIENTLSRDGTDPNTMGDDLDMNSNRIYNLPSPTTDTEPARKGDIPVFSLDAADDGDTWVFDSGLGEWIPETQQENFNQFIQNITDMADGLPKLDANALLPTSYLNRRYRSPRDFGAVVDGIADDTIPTNACAEFCGRYGYDFIFPSGLLRVTDTIKFGATLFSDLSFVTDRTSALTDTDFNSHINLTNKTNNRNDYKGCNIFCESGAVIVADLGVSTPTPVIEYNLYPLGPKNNFYGPLTITDPSAISDGMVDYSLVTNVPSNNLIGYTTYAGQKEVGPITFIGMGKGGLVPSTAYWTNFHGIYGWRCSEVANISAANAVKLDAECWYSMIGVRVDGDQLDVEVATEQCLDDIVIYTANTSRFRGRYLEDVDAGTGDGSGHYTITLGEGAGTSAKVVNCLFESLRSGSVRTSKKFLLINGTRNCVFLSCRENSHDIDADSLSNSIFIGTDFTDDQTSLPMSRFRRFENGAFDGGRADVTLSSDTGTANGKYGKITTGTLTTTAGNPYTFTVNNNKVTSSSIIKLGYIRSGNNTGGLREPPMASASSGVFTGQINNNAAALSAFNGTMVLWYEVEN